MLKVFVLTIIFTMGGDEWFDTKFYYSMEDCQAKMTWYYENVSNVTGAQCDAGRADKINQ